jgi:murein DD-endopeptidase MepM/ murein hydrolase activator NlpD
MPRLHDGRLPVVTSTYGPRTGGHSDFHHGVDILYPRVLEPLRLPWTSANGRWAVPDDVPALAIADGTVSKAGRIGTGDRVRVEHGAGIASGYFHMRNLRVRPGDRVKRGQPLGTVSYDPSRQDPALNHLHFEYYSGGSAVNPSSVLSGAEILSQPSEINWLMLAALAAGTGLLVARYI